MARRSYGIEALASDPQNARTITPEALGGLDFSVKEFGDLSGIVFNDRSGHLIAGHQRIKTLTAAGATEWSRDGDVGEIVDPRTGELFRIRFVDWDERKERLANLTANNQQIAGTYTQEATAQLEALRGDEAFEHLRLAQLAEQAAAELAKQVAAAGTRAPRPQTTAPVMGSLEYRVVVSCPGGETQQLSLMERLEGEGFKCNPLIS